jgi:hypothetical protein
VVLRRVARWFNFKPKNPNLGYILENLGMEDVVLFYDHLEYFMAILYNLWPFGLVVVNWHIFFLF